METNDTPAPESAPSNPLIGLKHRLADEAAIESPGDDQYLFDNLCLILERAAALADVVGTAGENDDPATHLIETWSIAVAARCLRLELMGARVVLEAWLGAERPDKGWVDKRTGGAS